MDSEYSTDEQPEWGIRTLKHAYTERLPTEYVVDKFFATQSLNIVYGAPGVMKSMLMADLCACVASDDCDWLPGAGDGGNGIPVSHAPIFWLDMDNGLRRTDERFDALSRKRDVPEDAPLYYVSMPNPMFIADDEDSVMQLMRVIIGVGAKLVVVDNLGLSTGDVEENSARMAYIMGQYRIVAERTGAAIILIHHQRKGGAGQSRAGDALRGHSSIEAAIDLALHVVREPNSLEVTIKSTKTRGVDVPMVTARFNYDHVFNTNDLRTAWFDGAPVMRGISPIRDTIIEVLTVNEAMTKGRLVDTVHERLHGEVGVLKIRNWVTDMLEASSELVSMKGSHNASIIRIKPQISL